MDKAPLDAALGNFMAMTAKSTVAVVIPLFGFWNDVPDNPVNGEVLSAALQRVYSHVHHLVLIFVAHPQSIDHDPKDPESVGNIILSKAQGGNVINVAVKRDDPYAAYVEEGLYAAINETKAQFMVVVNPWVLIQEGAIDVLVDRANFGDQAKIVSGYDMRPLVEPQHFDSFKTTMPKEEWDLSFNLLGMPRFMAEMLILDKNFKTHQFLERDLWQQVVAKGFGVIASQRIPVFPFDFPWSSFERIEDFKSDHAHFLKKWGFDPGFKFHDGDE